MKDTRLEYLEKLRKEFYEKNKERTDWEGMATRGHGRSYVSANAYNKSKFSFGLDTNNIKDKKYLTDWFKKKE